MRIVTKIKIYQIMIGYLITTVIIVLIDMISRVIFLYMLDIEKMKEAIDTCVKKGIDENDLFISSFIDDFAYNQKYVYRYLDLNSKMIF